MTQEVSARNPGAVLGDFSGASYRHGGVDARMDRDAGGAFRMTFTAADARAAAAPPVTAIVSRAIGSRRYQQYLTRIGDAEYRLPVAYHVEEKRWIHMNGAFLFAEQAADPSPSDSLSRPRERVRERVDLCEQQRSRSPFTVALPGSRVWRPDAT